MRVEFKKPLVTLTYYVCISSYHFIPFSVSLETFICEVFSSVF